VRPGNGDLYVANTDARNLTHFEPNVRSHSVDNRLTRIAVGSGIVTPFDLNSNLNYAVLPNPAAKTNALAQPTALVFDPSGAFLYIAAFGSDRVAKVDANGVVLARVELCPTATGSAAIPATSAARADWPETFRQRLYVLNRIANHDFYPRHRPQHPAQGNPKSGKLRPHAAGDSRGPRIPLRFEAQRQRHHGLRRLPH